MPGITEPKARSISCWLYPSRGITMMVSSPATVPAISGSRELSIKVATVDANAGKVRITQRWYENTSESTLLTGIAGVLPGWLFC